MRIVIGIVLLGLICVPAQAEIIAVSPVASSLGTNATKIAAPPHVLDDITTNTGMQGFDEVQGYLTTSAYVMDGGAILAAGTWVDSHLIFLNTASGSATHLGVLWVFDSPILGVMSDTGGLLEAASSGELGNPGTNYTATFPGSGPAAPFAARGLESNDGVGQVGEGYSLAAPFALRVGMRVAEPGDWIRVITVPEPSALALLAAGLGFVFLRRRR